VLRMLLADGPPPAEGPAGVAEMVSEI
jgi:hypothetical protein